MGEGERKGLNRIRNSSAKKLIVKRDLSKKGALDLIQALAVLLFYQWMLYLRSSLVGQHEPFLDGDLIVG